jgi:lipoprotein YgeR
MEKLQILFLIVSFGMLAGCATEEYKPMPTPIETGAPPPAAAQGIYHKVAAGQTLWQIAQAYGVGVDDIIKSNNIPNGSTLEVGQLLFIPGAQEVKSVAQPPPATAGVDNNKNGFIWPIKGKIIAYFNDPLSAGVVNHGIDIQAQPGDTVQATREGDVVLADYISGYGDVVMINHGDGFISVYAHNATLLVKLGQHVYKGDALAQVGQIGNHSLEHFEIRRGSQATNPLYYLP